MPITHHRLTCGGGAITSCPHCGHGESLSLTLEDPSSSSPSETSSPEESPRALKCVEWRKGGIRSLSHLCEGDGKSLCPATCWCPLGSACEHRDSFPSQKQPPGQTLGVRVAGRRPGAGITRSKAACATRASWGTEVLRHSGSPGYCHLRPHLWHSVGEERGQHSNLAAAGRRPGGPQGDSPPSPKPSPRSKCCRKLQGFYCWESSNQTPGRGRPPRLLSR